jgi:hypothetical protein
MWGGPRRRLKQTRKRRMNLATPQVSRDVILHRLSLWMHLVLYVWRLVLFQCLFFQCYCCVWGSLYIQTVDQEILMHCHCVRKFLMHIMYYILLFMYHKHNIPIADGLKYSRAPISADSVFTVSVIRGFFSFFLLGPVSVNAPVCTAAFKAYCAALNTRFSPHSIALCLL